MQVSSASGVQQFEICDECKHWKRRRMAKTVGGKVVQTCQCSRIAEGACHPPVDDLRPSDLAEPGWHEPASKSGTRLRTPYGSRQWG